MFSYEYGCSLMICVTGLTLSDSSELCESRKADDLTVLPYSSGTTGIPKGVMLSNHNLVSNCQADTVPLPDKPLILPTTNDFQEILPCFLPFFHIYGNWKEISWS